MSRKYWIAVAVVFLAMIATPGYFLYKTSHPVLSTVVLPDGTTIICPDPNYNPNYMDNPLGTLIISLIEGTYKIEFPGGDADITL